MCCAQLLFNKMKGPIGSDHNLSLSLSQVFIFFMVSGLYCCSFFPSGSELLLLPALDFSSFSSSNEGPKSGTSLRDLFLTSWKLSNLSYYFLESSEASTTNCWVEFVMHYFGFDATKEFHYESAIAST
jgi:hypothetical protein